MKSWIFVVVVFLAGCNDEGTVPPPDSRTMLSITGVSPSSAVIGQRVVITGTGFLDVGLQDPPTILFGGIETYRDSMTSTSMTCPVPLGATGNSITVANRTESATWVHFSIIQECPSGVCVLWNQVDPIQREEGIVTRSGQRALWTAILHGDTVELSREWSGGDEDFVRQSLAFRNPGGPGLPEFLSGTILLSSGPPLATTQVDSLSRGIVRIQEWNPGHALVGRFFGDHEIVFWYDGH